MRTLLFVAALLLCLPLHAAAQTRAQAEAIRSAMVDLRNAIRALPQPLRSEQLTRPAEWLLDRSQSAELAPAPVTVVDEYLETLRQAATLLRQRPDAAVVDDVARDLQAKSAHCRQLGLGMGGTVALTVNTERNGTPVRNLEVFYQVKFLELVKGTTATSFPGASSPVRRQVPPGRYVIWTRDPATGRDSERRLIEVFGAKEIAVTLPVTFP